MNNALPLYILNPNGPMSIPQSLLVAVVGILVVMLELALLTCFILLMSKIFKIIADKTAVKVTEGVTSIASVSASDGKALPDNQSQGKIDLVNIDEPTAAVVMAVVSHQSGIPLNRLNFKSIKAIEQEDK